MGKALLLRDCCALAVEAGTVVLAAHPKGDRAYPADLPERSGSPRIRIAPWVVLSFLGIVLSTARMGQPFGKA